jgi:membrane protein DedA with SNARE-associated domain
MTDALTPLGALPYLTVLIAAAIEGEVVFLTAAVLVGAGRLQPLAVFLAGALGASIGDQLHFYIFRLRVAGWLDRVPAIARRQPAIAALVCRHGSLVALGLRFVPGLRIVLAAGCAYGGLPALRFSILNLLGGLIWSATLLTLVAWAGPSMAARLEVNHTWVMVGIAVMLIGITALGGQVLKRFAETS